MASTNVLPTGRLLVENVGVPEVRVPDPSRVGAGVVQFVAEAHE
jgi:hypothetical protein